MTEISFHFNVPDRSAYACRLVRKASRLGSRIAVTGDAEMLSRFDRELWAFDPVEFVPHVRVRAGEPVAERLLPTRVWLLEDASGIEHHDVLLNLGQVPPPGFESFARLIEIVSTAEEDRLGGRERWRHYANRGYPIQRHEVAE